MNVLSLFDGISCGMVALERAGIKVDNYFSSEVDKPAISVSEHNHPNIIRLGDVTKIETKTLPNVDILIGGSPCQSFSFAGKMNGMSTKEDIEITTLKQYLKLKKEGFEFVGQSYLFWEYVRILKEVKPKYFLLENVKMLEKWQNIISETLGVEPILINSALVSAQNRKRLYWTNISNVQQPEDKKIFLRDIINESLNLETLNVPININGTEKKKSNTIRVNGRGSGFYDKHNWDTIYIKTIPHGYIPEDVREKEKYPTLCAQSPASKHLVRGAAKRNQVTKRGIEAQLNIRKDNKSNCVVSSFSEKLNGIVLGEEFRPLTPEECELLQTLPFGYTAKALKTQRYKMIGNGWTVDVIKHIFDYLPEEYKLR